MSNAIKFCNKAGGEIIISLKDENEFFLLSVEDNGIGLERTNFEKIFNRFEQIESGRNSPYQGTGIGLSFTKEIVKLLKGEIFVYSDGLGKGTTFTVKFKKGYSHFNIKESELNNIESLDNIDIDKQLEIITNKDIQAKNKNSVTVDFSKINNKKNDYLNAIILIVDDNPEILDIEKNILRKCGFSNFISAYTGKQGIEAAYEYNPDMIISDYNMPEMMGDEFYQELANNPNFINTPFVFLSAIADEKLRNEQLSKGAINFLTKPIDKENFIAVITNNIKRYFNFKRTKINSETDALTGLFNKVTSLKKLEERIVKNNEKELSLAFIDLDYFKDINDTFGHLIGDLILEKVGETLSEFAKDNGFAGRYGGDEFLLITYDHIIEFSDMVYNLSKKLKEKINSLEIENLKFSTSIGLTSFLELKSHNPSSLNLSLLLEKADEALYHAKKSVCNNCGFTYSRSTDFNLSCPKCNSKNISIGRDSISIATNVIRKYSDKY